MTPENHPRLPLDGLVVVEQPASVSLRYCGRLLVEHGATVWQVGAPPVGDAGYGGAASEAYARWLDRGKRRAPADFAGALELAGRVDLVLAGPCAGAVRAADDAIAARWPADAAGTARGAAHHGVPPLRAGLTWFASDGPYRDWQGDDALIQAMSGVAYATGPVDGDPLLPRGHAPQVVAGVTAAIAVLAVLLGRRRGSCAESGAGGFVRTLDVDTLEANQCFSESSAIGLAMSGDRVVRRGTNRFTPSFPAGIYPTADGWIGVTAITPAQWTAVCEMIGRPDLARVPRYGVSAERLADADLLDQVLVQAFRGRPSAWWLEEGQRQRVPFAPVPTIAELLTTPHWHERGSFAPLDGNDDVASDDAASSRRRPTGPTTPFRIETVLASEATAAVDPAVADGPQRPLAGLRVLDLSMGWAGPLATRHLADLGADVIKVESCTHFDWWRGFDALDDTDPPQYETRPSFLMVNRNKRGITIDLKSEVGRALVRRLAAGADVMVENYAPGVLERLGLGARAMARAVPGLVAISMGAFGNRGAWSGFRAYGSTVEQASGLPFVNGFAADAPTMQHVAFGDPIGGLYGAFACLVALHARQVDLEHGHRDRAGACAGQLPGRVIDLGQVESLFQLGADAVVAQSVCAAPLERQGNRHPAYALRAVVRCPGASSWLAVAVRDVAQWRALCALLGERDPGFEHASAEADRFEAALACWVRAQAEAFDVHDDPLAAAREFAGRLQRAGVPAAPVLAAQHLIDDPQLCATGYWFRHQRRFVGVHPGSHSPYRIDAARMPPGRPAPTLGEANDEVLGGLLGLDAGQREALARDGVIGTRAVLARLP